MKRFFGHNLTAWPTERLSTRVLYVLVGIIGVVVILFWLVGFSLPFDDDPNFTAPLFTNLLLVLMYILAFTGIVVGIWSVYRTLKVRGESESVDNNIPTRKLSYTIVFTTIASLLLFFLVGSSQPMRINGISYTDGFWLKVSDMFIYTSLLMIIAGMCVAAYGATKYNRKNDI